MEVYKRLTDISDRLVELYTGEAFEMFQQIVPICKNCKKVAVGCFDCTLCSKAILCSACVADGKTACKKCQKKNGDSPYTKASVNVVAQNILSAAQFRCPFAPQCPMQHIPYDDLEKHMRSECEFRLQHCPLKCDA